MIGTRLGGSLRGVGFGRRPFILEELLQGNDTRSAAMPL